MTKRKADVLEFLETNAGKPTTITWEELASQYGFKGEALRSIWKKHRKEKVIVPSAVIETISAEQRKNEYITELEEKIVKFETTKDGNAEFVFNTKTQIMGLEELKEKTRLDTNQWEIEKYVQSAWGTAKNPYFQVKVWLTPIAATKTFQDEFKEFLRGYKSPHTVIAPPTLSSKDIASCLIINKQDAHLNKFDVKGDNDIDKRFVEIENKIVEIVGKASVSNAVDTMYYILGSDQFNSEWTGTTTKGTPQQNIMSYQDSFTAICDHEVRIINDLLTKCKELKVIYLAGNHDEYVGWHMISWLKAYYRNQKNMTIDGLPNYRKCVRFHDSAIMFNHGDTIKPVKLAQMFPVEFRQEWSKCNHYYIFTGDKHHEVSADISGIKFYQLPSLSKAKSLWDDKQGHTCSKAEMTVFMLEKGKGLSTIFKELL